MVDSNRDTTETPDAAEFAQNMAKIAEQSQRLIQAFIQRQSPDNLGMADPLNIGNAFLELTTRMMANPMKAVQAQMLLWQDYMRLWQNTAQRMLGQDPNAVVSPEPGDRRFKDAAWEESALFDFIKQSYLLTARWMQATVNDVDGLDGKTAQKVDFYTRQFADAMAPSNFVLTNPEVLRETFSSNGQNLVKGLGNLLDDLDNDHGQLRIKMTDMEAFKVGENVAATPGQVVFRNDLFELIQYAPTTEKVHKIPLLVVPPWINKYYILDLRPKNSFVRWATEQGFTTFIISWVNPDVRLADKDFDSYVIEGLLTAFDAIEKATGVRDVTTLGLCLGGTLLATALGYMAAKGDDRVKGATFLAAQVDFETPGELAVFIDEEQLTALEERMEDSGGFLEASAMSTTFNMLRANDLIWSFVVNNYLMGRDPFPFDLLFWNSDSTRMPARMHSFYLRNMYQKNLLAQPGGLEINGVKIDLSQVKQPVYVVGTKEDHIAPWMSAYKATQIFGGPKRFVLGGSGHIAGMTNAPPNAKYGHWTNGKLPIDPEVWLRNAKQHDESWWVDWQKWNAKLCGPMVGARTPGDGDLPALMPAPGSYVMQKAE